MTRINKLTSTTFRVSQSKSEISFSSPGKISNDVSYSDVFCFPRGSHSTGVVRRLPPSTETQFASKASRSRPIVGWQTDDIVFTVPHRLLSSSFLPWKFSRLRAILAENGSFRESLTLSFYPFIQISYERRWKKEREFKSSKNERGGIKRRDKGCVVGWIRKNGTLHHRPAGKHAC